MNMTSSCLWLMSLLWGSLENRILQNIGQVMPQYLHPSLVGTWDVSILNA